MKRFSATVFLSTAMILFSIISSFAASVCPSPDKITIGTFESWKDTQNHYELVIKTYKGSTQFNFGKNSDNGITQAAIDYGVDADIATDMGDTDSIPLAAIFIKEGHICGFAPATFDEVYVQKYDVSKKTKLLNVCTDETDNCYKLSIDKDNYYYNKDNELDGTAGKVIKAWYAPDGELIMFTK